MSNSGKRVYFGLIYEEIHLFSWKPFFFLLRIMESILNGQKINNFEVSWMAIQILWQAETSMLKLVCLLYVSHPYVHTHLMGWWDSSWMEIMTFKAMSAQLGRWNGS